jgi:hypothetical protein
MRKKFIGTMVTLALLVGLMPRLALASDTASQTFTLVVEAPLTISTASVLPGAIVGASYSASFAAAGGVPPYTWSVTSGSSLPAGLSLSAAGVLSGTPSTAGSYSFSITVTDSAGNASTIHVVKSSAPRR